MHTHTHTSCFALCGYFKVWIFSYYLPEPFDAFAYSDRTADAQRQFVRGRSVCTFLTYKSNKARVLGLTKYL